MLHRFVSHLRGNLVAYLALFVALGGTSYAAVSLPRNSVGTRQLRSGAVTPSKLKAGAFGGQILFTAQVNAFGKVLSSQPRGATGEAWRSNPSLPPDGGLITWHRPIPKDCFAVANAPGRIGSTNAPDYANADVLTGRAKFASVTVMTPSPEDVEVAVICPTP